MTTRVRWEDEPAGYAVTEDGFIGPAELNWRAFRIWRPDLRVDPRPFLTSDLRGQERRQVHGTPDELKAAAERWLSGFTASLGAVFPEPARIEERPGKRKLTAADVLDSFRTVTNWSDAEVLHYESCGECDPFASVVCEAHPAAVEQAEHDREAAPAAAGEKE